MVPFGRPFDAAATANALEPWGRIYTRGSFAITRNIRDYGAGAALEPFAQAPREALRARTADMRSRGKPRYCCRAGAGRLE